MDCLRVALEPDERVADGVEHGVVRLRPDRGQDFGQQPRRPAARRSCRRGCRLPAAARRGPCGGGSAASALSLAMRVERVEKLRQDEPVRFEAELIGDRVLQVVGLIDHEVMVFGQHTVLGRGVGHQQRVVDDDHVGGLGLFARPVEKAAAPHVPLAAVERAAFVFGRHLTPDEAVGWQRQRQLALVARLRARQPDQDAGDPAQLLVAGIGPRLERREAAWAQVVATAFQQRRAEGGGFALLSSKDALEVR